MVKASLEKRGDRLFEDLISSEFLRNDVMNNTGMLHSSETDIETRVGINQGFVIKAEKVRGQSNLSHHYCFNR